MVDERTGVVKLFPVAIGVPPVEFAYHFTVPFDAVALKFTVPFPHLLCATVEVIEGITMVELVEICKTGSPGIPPYSTI